jgi:alpha-1,2-mannosyltransferase
MTAGTKGRTAQPPGRSLQLRLGRLSPQRPGRRAQLAQAADGDGPPARARTPLLAVGAAAFAISLAAFLFVFTAFSQHPWSMLDLHVYLWGGAAVRHSHDPYVGTYLAHSLHFTYTPMAAGIFAVIDMISLPVVQVLAVAGSVAALVAVLWLTWGLLGHERSRERLGAALAVAALALWLEPVLRTISFGQVNLVLMLLIVADLAMPDTRWWKGVGVGLAAGFKLTPLVFIPYLLLTRRFRAAAVAAATFAITVGGSFVFLPRAARHYWIQGLFLNVSRVGNARYVGNQSLFGALLRLIGGPTAAARPYQLVAEGVVGVAGLALAAWASRRGQEAVGILVCALTGLLISPVSWSHHWVWIAPMLVVLAHFATRPPVLAAAVRWRRFCWLGVVAMVAVFSGVLWTVPASRPAGCKPSPQSNLCAPQQGYSMSGFQQLVGDLYVLAGLAGLCVIAALLVLARRRDRRGPVAAAVGDDAEPSQPGLAARS